MLDHRAPPAMLADEPMSNTEKSNDAVKTALEMVAESRPRMNGYTSEERAQLEKEGRAMMTTDQPSAGAVRAALAIHPEFTQAWLDSISPECARSRMDVFVKEHDEIRAKIAAVIDRETRAREQFDALVSIRRMTCAEDSSSYRWDDREGCLDAVHAAAVKALKGVSA